MRWLSLNKRAVLLVSALLFLFVIVPVSVFLMYRLSTTQTNNGQNTDTSANQQTNTTPEAQSPVVSGASLVTLNLTPYVSDLNSDTQTSIKGYLYNIMTKAEKSDLKRFSGTIRTDSYTKTTTSNDSPRIDFLVDMNEIKVTYQVSVEGDTTTDYSTLYVVCAPVNKQVSQSAQCKDLQ